MLFSVSYLSVVLYCCLLSYCNFKHYGVYVYFDFDPEVRLRDQSSPVLLWQMDINVSVENFIG